MTVDTPDSAGALRSDARRNRARVLDVALEVFAAEGSGVTLGEIARRAGVGAGTVYRHFPSKERLFEEVLAHRTRDLVAWGRELIAHDAEPGARFFAFFEHTIQQAGVNRALCDGFHAVTGRQTRVAAEIFEGYHAVLGELLGAAQAAGAVRTDVDVDDVHALIAGAASVRMDRPPGKRCIDLCGIIADGLRADVMKLGARIGPRDETEAMERNETPAVHTCAECGGPIAPAGTGRPAKYCGAACRQKAHRRRKA